MPNRLAAESSPYLLQHADNPVDWYPWGPEALERARSQDRPILLSIGYSACHWCHVMERESFEDTDTAALMNGLFVNIKVDREERPDLDAIYMKAVQAMTGHGGWPLTAVLTPEGIPFFGGTYFPPVPRQGMASFRQVLEATARAYHDRREDVTRAAGELRRLLEHSTSVAPTRDGSAEPGGSYAPLLDRAFRSVAAGFDEAHGGFGSAPKFPQPVVLDFLLRHHARTGSERALAMVHHTLLAMAQGGIRDQLDGGFHRYAVDERWLVPHFEKMLYDNALLARAYVNAWQATGDARLRQTARECLSYLTTDLQAPEGGFFSARDADSEGEEGRFYLWTPDEVEAVLGPEEARLFNRVYDVSAVGNFESRNILHRPHESEATARAEGQSPAELEARLERARDALLEARARRVAPLRDEKVLSGWTAMTIRTLAEAGGAMDEPAWLAHAETGARFLLGALRRDGRLLHTFKDGRARITGFLEDYGALGNALLTLHEVTLEPAWLPEVRWVCDRILELFVDEKGVPFDTPVDGERLLVRPRETMDNATPSGTSLAAELLLRAAVVFDDARYREVGEGVAAREAGVVERYPLAFGRLLSVLEGIVSGAVEVALVGSPEDAATRALHRTVLHRYLPNRVIVGGRPGEGDLPLLRGRGLVDGLPTAYVCRHYACEQPTNSVETLAAQLP